MADDRSARRTIGVDASRAFVAQPTGTERYATALITALVDRDRHDYRLYTRSTPETAPPPGAEVRRLPAPRLWTHTRLAWEVLHRPPDVLFVPAHVLPLVYRGPAVVTVHDLGYLAFPDAHPLAQRVYLDWSTRRHVNRATHVIADSAATRDDLIRHYGADPARITVVHLGVDPDFRPQPASAIRRLRATLDLGEAPYLLHVGTLQPRKNLPRLLAAFARLRRAHQGLQLVLAGAPGWGDEDLARVARRLGIAAHIHRPGYLPRPALPALYSGAKALVFPSLHEGFGLPMLEAMACGTAVAASNRSSLPEIGADAARYFDPLDVDDIARTLTQLLEDDDRRTELAAAGKARAARFTWQRCAAETEVVLERAAAARRSAN